MSSLSPNVERRHSTNCCPSRQSALRQRAGANLQGSSSLPTLESRLEPNTTWIAAILLTLLCICAGAKADVFYTLVGFTCDSSGDRLVIYYRGGWNEPGDRLTTPRTKTEWRPGDLVNVDDDGNVTPTKPVDASCNLTSGRYRIRITAKPGNSNVGRRCGAQFADWLEVWRDGEIVLPRTATEGDCFEADPAVTEIVFSNATAPAIKRLPRADFYR